MRKNEDFRKYYDITNTLSEGKYIKIFNGKSKENNGNRAIKVVYKNQIKNVINQSSRHPNNNEMKECINGFIKEIENMKIAQGKNKDNENAVKLYEYFDTQNEFALVMELCDDNMENYLSKKRNDFTKEEYYKIINQLNNSFTNFAKEKLVFGEITLKNILLKYENENRTKFDIKLKFNDQSNLMQNLSNSETSIRRKKTSNNYKAPEILKGGNYNIKSDLWNLGIILYVLFFKKYPFDGSNIKEILENIQLGEEKLEETNDENLDDLISKLLKENPKERMEWNEYFNHAFFKRHQKMDFWSKYKDKEKISNTRYATIYKVLEMKSLEYRAIKVYDKKLLREDFKLALMGGSGKEKIDSYIEGFYNEINHMKMLCEEGNINTVKIIDSDETEDEVRIVMELCDENLLDFFSHKKENFNFEEIYDFLNQINNTLKIMSQKKLVHRALNLQNILVKYTNKEKSKFIFKIKLTDDCGLLDEIKNKPFKIKENYNFYPPEILNKKNDYEKCDLWSLGVIIYILLFRKYPYTVERKKDILIINRKPLLKTKNTDLDNLIDQLLIDEPIRRLSWDEYFHNFFRSQDDYKLYYKIGKKIGEAENAIVYIGEKIENKEKRAIKIYRKHKIRAELKKKNLKEPSEIEILPYIDSIFNEIKHLQMLDKYKNKNVVKFYEYFQSNDEFAVITEFCDINLLNYFLKYKPFNLQTVQEILNQLNNGLRIMVQSKIVHRALNLDNILVNINNNGFIIKLKLTDDSILLKDLPSNQRFDIKSTLNFVAPEILKKQEYNEKCDLWSLGVIIYTLAYNEYPYMDDTNSKRILSNIKKLEIKTDNENLKDLLESLLIEDPNNRIGWNEYFNHPFFAIEQDYKKLYEIKKEITSTDNAKIYLAREIKTNELRAIKIYNKRIIVGNIKRSNIKNPCYNEMNPYIKGFLNEVNLMEMIEEEENNKYTVKCYEHFQTKNEFIIVMELCDNNLFDVFLENKQTFNLDKIKQILNQLNYSLKIMYRKKIIHRALNLENILVKYENQQKTKYIVKLKLTDDCGLISDFTPKDKIKTKVNKNFVAPEILNGNEYIDKCDLWSIGCIIYTLHFKEYPIKSDNENEILKEIRTFKLKKSSDNKMDNLIKTLLVEDPQNRLSWDDYFNHAFFK